MKQVIYNIILSLALLFGGSLVTLAENQDDAKEELNAKELIMDHLADSYEWHIVSTDTKHIAIPLPVILYSKTTGWHLFSSSHFHYGTTPYKGFEIASEGKYKAKIVENGANGDISRPLDISLTKTAASLVFSSILLILIIMGVARLLKSDPMKPRKGFPGMIEMLVLSINDDIIKPSIGKDSQRYAPYLLTVFFFIFTNNLLGLIPIFPGGANVTGNIAVTFVLAIITFVIVNVSGTKEYYKEILWPDVPTWLKVPIPLMPVVEIVGTLTKPFALMIRLFANMMAGHSIVLGLTVLIFVTADLGFAINSSMTVLSIIFTVFIDLVELLIAYIQSYVFTLLSAVFIGLARIEPHSEKKKVIETGHVV